MSEPATNEIVWLPDHEVKQIYAKRINVLDKLRADEGMLEAFKVHYRNHPWDFVNDWGMTYDPRLLEKGLNPIVPFKLFPRQYEFLEWLQDRYSGGERGLVEKSRDFGATWLCVGFAVSHWLFSPGFAVGFGSRKQDLVDKKGDPKCIFEKARPFIRMLPDVLQPDGYSERDHATFLKISNPENGATITGEAGDDIGRGARMSVYFVDESAFIARQESVDAALSQTTNCQVDVSTPNGNGNAFYKKRHGGNIPVFTMHWKDDPRKNDAWYNKQKRELNSVIVAQEIDIDYNASIEDIFIPAKWVEATIDAHLKLGWVPEGIDVVSFDPADVGDAKARGHRKGNVLLQAQQKKDGDITDAMPWAFDLADTVKADVFDYDADGMGAPSMKLYLNKVTRGKKMTIVPFYGSGKLWKPNVKYMDGKLNKDKFENRRAQAWMNFRDLCENTYEAVTKGTYIDPNDLVSISSDCEALFDLKSELSRPLRIFSKQGKIMVESKADMKRRQVESPNLADMCVMAFDPGNIPSDKKDDDEIRIPNAVSGHR